MLVSLWVRRRARRLGIARRLVDAALAWVDAEGDDEVVLWVRHDNRPAIELYQSVGFTATGRVEASPIHACVNELELRRVRLGAPGPAVG
jgi:ribosomal protein S18 acetylase RimI-like enzyme